MNRSNPLSKYISTISEAKIFMLMLIFVNGGNYLYNLVLGQILGPEQFAHAAFLITALLSLSFVAMTFQLVLAKFFQELSEQERESFLSQWYRRSIGFGFLLTVVILIFGNQISMSFQLDDSRAIAVFAVAMPFYFLFNVQRGKLQSQERFIKLGQNYLVEMGMRFFTTISLLFLFPNHPTLSVSIGILVSIISSIYIIEFKLIFQKIKSKVTPNLQKNIFHFVMVTMVYELTLNLLNSADILIVKQNYESTEAGMYASIALIGRMVYYITWMYAMILLPRVVRLKKEGKDIRPLLHSTLGQVLLISALIIIATVLFPETIVRLFFGSAYVSQAHLLGIYALSTGIFCVSNIFCYTYLSLSKYIPVALSAIVAVFQVLGLTMIQGELSNIVWFQVICMSVLLVAQCAYHLHHQHILSSTVNDHLPLVIGTQTN